MKLAIGKYDEPRLLYTAPEFGSKADPTAEHRMVHIGLDLFAPVGTPVFTPLDGVVHAFADNRAPQDYGPVIVLRHETDDGTPFFTLYGHLSRKSLDGLVVGTAVKAGEQIATLGPAAVNGGWTPHLHLQIITDILELDTDFPGRRARIAAHRVASTLPRSESARARAARQIPAARARQGGDAGRAQSGDRAESQHRVSRSGEGRARLDAASLRRRRAPLSRRVQQRAARRPLRIRAW